jgi:hypothetical protein
MNTSKKPLSSCCEKRIIPNMVEPGKYLCNQCGQDCQPSQRKAPFRGYSTLSTARKVTGEGEAFAKVWERCKGKSEVSGEDLLPYGRPMWHHQFSHCLPKGSYGEDRLELANIVACTVKEHTEEWPLVKEKTDAELKAMGMSKWVPVVTRFRAMRLKYHQRLNTELSGKQNEH